MIRKWPGIYFGGPRRLRKILAAQKHHLRTGQNGLQDKATLPLNIGMETTFWAGEIETRYTKERARRCGCTAKRPAVFPPTIGISATAAFA